MKSNPLLKWLLIPMALVLLFVGIGYIVLWYFEDQQVTAAAATARAAHPGPAPGPGDTPN